MMLQNETDMASTVTTGKIPPPRQLAATVLIVALLPKPCEDLNSALQGLTAIRPLLLNLHKLGFNTARLILNQSVSLYSSIREDPLRLLAELPGTNPST